MMAARGRLALALVVAGALVGVVLRPAGAVGALGRTPAVGIGVGSWSPASVVAPASIGVGSQGSPWDDRLTRLDPSDPMGYLELAEEIDDTIAGRVGPAVRAEQALVEQLYGLAGLLDPRLAPGAARALAELARDPDRARRLRALAELREGDRVLRGRPRSTLGGEATGDPGAGRGDLSTGVLISEAIASYRRGDGERGLRRLESKRSEGVLRAAMAEWPGGFDGFRADCARRGPIDLSLRRLQRELAAEAAIIGGRTVTFDEDVRSEGAGSLVEIDPERLDEVFRVDVTRCVWRDGAWVRPEGADRP